MTTLHERLRRLRLDNSKEKEELAVYLSISVDSYNRYERGSREPGVETLIKIANYYDCTLDYLMGRDELKYPTFDYSKVVSYRDLVELGFNGNLAHGLITQITRNKPFEELLQAPYTKVKFVKKSELRAMLLSLAAMEELQDEEGE